MPESSPDNRFSFSDSQGETTSWQPPLGLQKPLVTSNPLGQNFLSPQFLSPLGAQPLGGGNPLGTSAQSLPDYNLSENFFQDSPPLAESKLSLNPPETPVTAAATPTAGMDSTQVNIQRYPEETPTATDHENNPIPAASDSLSEAERRLLGQDQAQVTTQELQIAAPHEQLGASDTAPLNPTVVQPQLATEPLLQREIAIPEAPEAVETSRESLVSESEPRMQIPEVAEEPPAIAKHNPSVMRSADLSNVPPPQTSPVAPLPSLPAEHLSGIEPIVSAQAELSPVHVIDEPAQDTEQNTQDVPSVPVQRQEDKASPSPLVELVESLPLPNPAFSDVSQSPQSFVQTQATADSPPQLNPPTAESPSAIAPVLASDTVSVQPYVVPNSDSESVAIAQTETSNFPPSTAGESESVPESGITPSEPTVVQAFSETESSALSQTPAAPLESPVLTQLEHHESSTIGEPVADSSTPFAKPEPETITSSSPPTLEEPQQRTETSRVDTDTAPSHSEIVQPSLERAQSAQSKAAFAPASDATAQPEPLVLPPPAITEVSNTPVDATPVAESELTIAQLFSEPESSESIEVVSSQENEPSTSTAAFSTPINEPIANALLTSTESAATQTNSPEPVVQSLPEPEAIDAPPNAGLETPDTQLISETTPTAMQAGEATQTNTPEPVVQLLPEPEAIDASPKAVLETPDTQLISETTPTAMQAEEATQTNIPEPVVQLLPEPEAIDAPSNAVMEMPDTQLISETAPTAMQAEEVYQQVQQDAAIVEDTGEGAQQEENSSATPLPTSDTASTTSAISTNLLQRSTTADETFEGGATPESLSTPVESTGQLPELTIEKTTVSKTADITSQASPEKSGIQRQLLPETQETAPDAIAPTTEEVIAHPDITSPQAPEESGIQTQLLPKTQETAPDAIAPTPEEVIAHPDITSPQAPEESGIQTQLLPETQETAPDAIAPTTEEVIAHPDITSPQAPEESGIQTQLLPETQETAPDAIAPTTEEVIAHPDITSPQAPEESGIQTQLQPETQETAPDAIAPTPEATEISQLDENTSFTEPIIPQPLLESDANLQSKRLPTAKNPEEAQDNSPQVYPVSPNSPPLPTHLLQTKTNVTGDESFNHNQDIPQLPTVLENLVGTRHTLPLIQPLNQQSSLLSTASTSEFSREPSTIVQSMPETSHRLVVPSTTPSTLPDDAFNQAQQSNVKVPPVSLDTEPLTLQRATDALPNTTPESHQKTQQVGSSTYTSEIPNSWSSIADLLENTTTNSSSAFGGEIPIQMAFNDATNQQTFDWQESNHWENLIPEYSRTSESSLTFSQETPIQRFTSDEAPVQDENSATEAASQYQDTQHEDAQKLEVLAREIYNLVRQRLAIERERYGHY